MTGGAARWMCASVAVAVAPIWAGAPGPQRPTFRAATDLVSVNVSVKDGAAPVTGLTAADFVLTDRGVAQTIDAVSIEAVPIDVSILIDLSGSVTAEAGPFQRDIRAFVGLLRPTDRVRLVTFADAVVELLPMSAPSVMLPLDRIRPGGSTSLNDALLLGLSWTTDEIDRRHLVVVFTDGYDSRSTLDNQAVLAIAARADAVLHAVLADSPVVFPRYRASRETLVDAARRSGGDAHTLGRAVTDFRAIVEDFRSSYVLRYTPKGVPREGWHELAVRVTRPGPFTVRARQGYDGG